jgi:hypothetical protein
MSPPWWSPSGTGRHRRPTAKAARPVRREREEARRVAPRARPSTSACRRFLRIHQRRSCHEPHTSARRRLPQAAHNPAQYRLSGLGRFPSGRSLLSAPPTSPPCGRPWECLTRSCPSTYGSCRRPAPRRARSASSRARPCPAITSCGATRSRLCPIDRAETHRHRSRPQAGTHRWPASGIMSGPSSNPVHRSELRRS